MCCVVCLVVCLTPGLLSLPTWTSGWSDESRPQNTVRGQSPTCTITHGYCSTGTGIQVHNERSIYMYVAQAAYLYIIHLLERWRRKEKRSKQIHCTCSPGSSFFFKKVTALGVLCCFAFLFAWPCLLYSILLHLSLTCIRASSSIIHNEILTHCTLYTYVPHCLRRSGVYDAWKCCH